MAEEEQDHRSLFLFGRDVSRIPCFRSSFLYGIGGGIGTGLLTFMFTSRPKMAMNFAVASFSVITMAYWTQCRYNYSKTKFELAQLKAGLQRHVMYEGTEMEKQILEEQRPSEA